MTTIAALKPNLTLAARWRHNHLDAEAGRPPTHELTPAQIASVKSTLGFPNWTFTPAPPCTDDLRCHRTAMPIRSYGPVTPGKTMDVDTRSMYTWFPLHAFFSQDTLEGFEVETVSLRVWNNAPITLCSNNQERIDATTINQALDRIAIPSGVELVLRVQNVDDNPRDFICAILCFYSVSERRDSLLRDRDRRPGWWREDHQRLVDLPAEEARRIDNIFGSRADGAPRQLPAQLRRDAV